MRRSSPLTADPAKTRAWQRRGKPLQRESARRRGERDRRAEVREETKARAGWRCEAATLVPEVACSGPLDVDEVIPRGVRPGGHLEAAHTQALCRAHHDWKGLHPVEAEARGLRRWSWNG